METFFKTVQADKIINIATGIDGGILYFEGYILIVNAAWLHKNAPIIGDYYVIDGENEFIQNAKTFEKEYTRSNNTH